MIWDEERDILPFPAFRSSFVHEGSLQTIVFTGLLLEAKVLLLPTSASQVRTGPLIWIYSSFGLPASVSSISGALLLLSPGKIHLTLSGHDGHVHTSCGNHAKL